MNQEQYRRWLAYMSAAQTWEVEYHVVHGRKPTPEEFDHWKQCYYDLHGNPSIAAPTGVINAKGQQWPQ